MTRAEWMELTMIGVVAAAGGLVRPVFPSTMPLWQMVLGLSALLLAQSLVRDVSILLRRSRANQPRREAQCFCLESTAGATGIVAGAALAGLGGALQVSPGRWEFLLAIAGTMAFGFAIKDWVVSWKPFGLRREQDHLNLIVRWKAGPH